jgi:hypothetical protein
MLVKRCRQSGGMNSLRMRAEDYDAEPMERKEQRFASSLLMQANESDAAVHGESSLAAVLPLLDHFHLEYLLALTDSCRLREPNQAILLLSDLVLGIEVQLE